MVFGGGAKFCTFEEERGEKAIPNESEDDVEIDGGDIGLAFSLPFVAAISGCKMFG